MAIDDTTQDAPKFLLHNGPLSEFYPDPADRAQFTYLGRARASSVDHAGLFTSHNPTQASDEADRSFIREARSLGGTIAFNVHSTPCAVGQSNSSSLYVLVTGDVYKRELR